MIKIIKEGIKEFRATCPFCSCEFTYERDDVHDGMVDSIVNCPCCGAIITVKSHLCESCPHYLRETYVGDLSCLWCQYGGPRVTCTSTGTSINGVK